MLMYIYMYDCMYSVFMCVYMCIYIQLYMYVCMLVFIYVCMQSCIYLHVCMYVFYYVCMFVHMQQRSIFRSEGSSNPVQEIFDSKKFSIRTEKNSDFPEKFLISQTTFIFSPQLKICKQIPFKFAFLRKYSPLTPAFSLFLIKTRSLVNVSYKNDVPTSPPATPQPKIWRVATPQPPRIDAPVYMYGMHVCMYAF